MTPVAVVHDPDGRQIGEDHSTDGSPTTGLTDVGDPLGPDATNRDKLRDLPRAAIRMLGRCEDFGRLDMSWLYAADESDSMSEYQPTLLPVVEVIRQESLPLGLAVS